MSGIPAHVLLGRLAHELHMATLWLDDVDTEISRKKLESAQRLVEQLKEAIR